VEGLTLLLQCGADLHTIDNGGWTPLHHAATFGKVESLRLLLEHGANVEVKNYDGDTPLDIAKLKRFDGLAKVLLSASIPRPVASLVPDQLTA